MPKAELKAGRHIETLNQQELEDVLSKQTAAFFQEEARGYTTARFWDNQTINTATVTVPANDDTVFGPDQGLAWSVKRVSAQGLTANDVLKVFRNDPDVPGNFLGYITATSNFSPSKGVILRGGEKLIVTGAALTATGDITVNGEAAQAAELDIFKLL